MWSFDETVERVVERLTPLYQLAASSPTPKFINLDMEEYRDLDLTMAVFTGILSKPQFARARGGHRAAGLPARRARRAADAHRVGDGQRRMPGRSARSRCASSRAPTWRWSGSTRRSTTGRSPPTRSKQSTDTNYKRVLDWALTPEHTDAVKIGVAGHNLFDVAYAWLLA